MITVWMLKRPDENPIFSTITRNKEDVSKLRERVMDAKPHDQAYGASIYKGSIETVCPDSRGILGFIMKSGNKAIVNSFRLTHQDVRLAAGEGGSIIRAALICGKPIR